MITQNEMTEIALFAALPDDVRSRVLSRSAEIRANPGECIVNAGDAPYFWTLLEGTVEVLQRFGGEMRQVTTFEPGDYFGEVPLLLGTDSSVTVRALTPARLMRTDPTDFHLMLTASSEASAIITQSLLRRVNFRSDLYVAANVTEAAIVGKRNDFACHELRDFLSRNQIAFEWLDPGEPTDAANMPESVDSLYPINNNAIPGYQYSRINASMLSNALLQDKEAVIINMLCDTSHYLNAAQGNLLLQFVSAGHKLLIVDSDECPNQTSYAFLIAASRLVPKGYGYTHPVASNTTNAGKALNRRVELFRL